MALIDNFAPAWQFREIHRIAVRAPAEAARRAIREVTAHEIRLFRALTWLRRLGRAIPPGILNPPGDQPILDVALRSEFLLLAESPREIVIGRAVAAPHGVPQPANPDEFRTITVMNFRVDPTAPALCVVHTETGVWASDPRTRRNFGFYWWTIRLGSGLIRRMWLRAIRRRAEKIGS